MQRLMALAAAALFSVGCFSSAHASTVTLDFTVSSDVGLGSINGSSTYSEDGFTVDGSGTSSLIVVSSFDYMREGEFRRVGVTEFFKITNDLGNLFTLDAFEYGLITGVLTDRFKMHGFKDGSEVVDYGTFETGLASVIVTTNNTTLIDELRITATGAQSFSPYWDNIVLTTHMPAVPLPAGLPLLLAGIGGLGLVARSKRKAA